MELNELIERLKQRSDLGHPKLSNTQCNENLDTIANDFEIEELSHLSVPFESEIQNNQVDLTDRELKEKETDQKIDKTEKATVKPILWKQGEKDLMHQSHFRNPSNKQKSKATMIDIDDQLSIPSNIDTFNNLQKIQQLNKPVPFNQLMIIEETKESEYFKPIDKKTVMMKDKIAKDYHSKIVVPNYQKSQQYSSNHKIKDDISVSREKSLLGMNDHFHNEGNTSNVIII